MKIFKTIYILLYKNILLLRISVFFIKIYEDKPSEAAIKKVVAVLKDGGLVIYPTDTVYGLGCDITNSRALEKLAKIKGIKLE